MNPHLVLLGDSIFDNVAYTEGGPAVIDQVRQHLPPGWKASLLAVDGDVCADIAVQLERLPADASHLAISIGGNDVLGILDRLFEPTSSVINALAMLAEVQADFRVSHGQALDAARTRGLPLLVCTVYDQIPMLTPALRTGLSLFNDVIVRSAHERGLPVLDLRTICTEREDYSTDSPIEPSCIGGDKLARALVCRVLDETSGRAAGSFSADSGTGRPKR